MDSVLFVFSDFNPVSNFNTELIREAINMVNPDQVMLINSPMAREDRIFLREEKVMLIGSILPNVLKPRYTLDGESFSSDRGRGVVSRLSELHGHFSDKFLLLDSRRFKSLSDSDKSMIPNLAKLILYVFPEDREVLATAPLTTHHPILINPTDRLNDLSRASIFMVKEHYYPEDIIDYINKSAECAIKRVKSQVSEPLFKHTLRVAGTVKYICDMMGLDNTDLRYDSYLAALYHDICKEFEAKRLISIARRELNLPENLPTKVLHGPVAGWYLRARYLFDNEDVLEAVREHTIPSENPKDITKILYLSDNLEPMKKLRYPSSVYDQAWNLLDARDLSGAFNHIRGYWDGVRRERLRQS